MIAVARGVNFGAAKASLTTVGYKLVNSDGSVKVARTTSGVSELITATGMYGAEIIFDEGWTGFIVWDTGGGSPIYAVDQYDYRHFLSYAPVYGPPSTSNASNKADLDNLKSMTRQVIKKIDALPEKINVVNDSVSKVLEGFRATNHVNLDTIIEAIRKNTPKMSDLKEEIRFLKEGLESVGLGIEALIESNELGQKIKEIENVEIPSGKS